RGDTTALEKHLHDPTVLSDWLVKNIRGYSADRGLISIDVNGVTVTDFSCRIFPADDVRIYPVAGTLIQAIQIGLLLFSVVYALTHKTASASYETGTALAVANTRAVQSSPGEVIRETLGCCRSYPDYAVQQTMRFTSPYNYYVYMYVSLGTGTYAHNAEEILIGDTPVSSFDADYTFYAANATVKNDERTENWYNCTNVGATTSASGLDLGTTSPSTVYITGDSATVSSTSVTINQSGDDDTALTEMFTVGEMLTVRVPFTVRITDPTDNSEGVMIIRGEGFDRELNFAVGDAATIVVDDKSYDLYVSRIWPETTDTSGNSLPTGYTFSSTQGTETAWNGASAGVSSETTQLIVEPTGAQYYVTSVSSSSFRVSQYINGELSSWNGFYARTQTDYDISYVDDNDIWLGPFVASPEDEEVDALEVNFTFPNGLIDYNNKGKKKNCSVDILLAYSLDEGVSWQEKTFTYKGKDVDGIGFTERITFSAAKNVQVRCRRTNEAGEDNRRDNCYWQALRTRLTTRPSSYPVPTFALTLRSGGMLAADSERQLSLKLTRQYTRGAE
ncbi:TPA: hypothetical protein U0F90_004871, partial [Escherichia coli]|nr:hypothetical protein [Escherichia coli]